MYSSSDESEDEVGWEAQSEDELYVIKCQCLFCSQMEDSQERCLLHMKSIHNFDLLETVKARKLDFYSYVKFINFARQEKLDGDTLAVVEAAKFSSDKLFIPQLEDDALLQLDIEDIICETPSNGSIGEDTLAIQLANSQSRERLAREELERALQELSQCRLQTQALLLDSNLVGDEKPSEAPLSDESDCGGYFSSYSHFGIHEEMLKDGVRTNAYRDFIEKNPGVFQGKVVLDVGCGSGVLSMFAARSGARHVIAVDFSEVAYQAMDIVRENGLQDVITVVKGRAEELVLPAGIDSVDVIISEWMGYFLLFESMLDSVLCSRDRYLRTGGCVYPDRCNMQLVALSNQSLYSSRIGFWDDVYGLKMSSMKSASLQEASVSVVDAQSVISKPVVLKEFDLMSTSVHELDFECEFELAITTTAPLHALVGYFDVSFERDAEHPISFSTGPQVEPTHWKQCVFFMKNCPVVSEGEVVSGKLECCKQEKDKRALIVKLSLSMADGQTLRQTFAIS